MQSVSNTYKSIVSGSHWFRVRMTINGVEFGESNIVNLRTSRSAFEDNPTIGCCLAGTLEASVAVESVPTMAEMRLYVRAENDESESEWIPKGVYIVDSRSTDKSNGLVSITAFDPMLKAEQDYVPHIDFPTTASAVVNEIATAMGIGVDSRVYDLLSKRPIPFPGTVSCREMLGYIGAMSGGNWIITDSGNLMIVKMNGIPEETNYLIDSDGMSILIGGDRILV